MKKKKKIKEKANAKMMEELDVGKQDNAAQISLQIFHGLLSGNRGHPSLRCVLGAMTRLAFLLLNR